ncbi:MAG: serpin family protein, partial [Oscillospiraceae bacterium]|nr:serpin family protein [Oscillospiraceae bacterium]
ANVTAATELETEPAEGFRAAQLNFTANLLKESAKAKGTEKSILVSPYSVAMALGMTANGAKEQTRTEMETVLGGSLKMDELNNSYLNILQNSPKSGTEEVVSDGYNEYRSATLDIANSIWYNEDPNLIQVPEEFLQKSVDYYGAEAFAANGFELPVIKDINYWVRNNTHGMIDKILPENENISIDPIVMILVNALAFEGDWSVPFRNDQVSAADFTLENGEKFKTDMMYDDDHIYFEDDSAVGFKKYYEGGKYSFIGVLPNEELTISQYVGNLTGEKLQKFLDSESRDYEVDYAFPKFKYDFDLSLKNPLIEMGMPSAFDGDKADFSGLNERPDQQTYISDVLHKTHIEVDQKGTRAAAVTAVIMAECTAVGPEFHKTVRLDRPFVYMIYDEERKLPVFIGTVMQPSEATAEAEPEPVFPDVNP